MEIQNQTQDKVIEFFLAQFSRFKEGRRLAREGMVVWDEEDRCFRVNGHKVAFDSHRGWNCQCEDQIYRAFMICKHLSAVIFYMGGIEAEDFR